MSRNFPCFLLFHGHRFDFGIPSGATYALVLGEQELSENRIGLKPLRSNDEQESIALDDLASMLQDRIGGA